MKGLIFTQFLEMVAEVFSAEMVEEIIDAANLPNEGAYTDVGTYPYEELISLVSCLSAATHIPIPDLELSYGKFLFNKLLERYKKLILQSHNCFEFLQQVDNHIHIEVLKLYPEAELPRFECTLITPTEMTMTYRSNHPFAKLAEGLILGCAEHFGETLHLRSQQLGPTPQNLHNVRFILTRE